MFDDLFSAGVAGDLFSSHVLPILVAHAEAFLGAICGLLSSSWRFRGHAWYAASQREDRGVGSGHEEPSWADAQGSGDSCQPDHCLPSTSTRAAGPQKRAVRVGRESVARRRRGRDERVGGDGLSPEGAQRRVRGGRPRRQAAHLCFPPMGQSQKSPGRCLSPATVPPPALRTQPTKSKYRPLS